MRIALVIVIAALLSPLTMAAAQPFSEKQEQTWGLMKLAMRTAIFLAYDEHCEPLPPTIKALIVNNMRQLSTKDQQIIAALQASIAKPDFRPELCRSTRPYAREMIEEDCSKLSTFCYVQPMD